MGQPGGEPYDPNTGYYDSNTEYYGPPQYAPGYAPSNYGAVGGYPGHPPPPGYVVPGYRPPRPAQATAAAVLGYVAAGLLIAAGLLLFLGASLVAGLGSLTNTGPDLLTAELVIDAMLNLVAGGLLIGGAAMFAGGESNGRGLLSVGSGIVLALAIYWIARTGGAGAEWALSFGALVIVALAMAWTRSATQWLAADAKARRG